MTPRRLAFDILAAVEKNHLHADVLLDRALRRDTLKGPDRGLLTELVYGTLRRQGTLDHIIATFCSTKPAKLERSVILLLRLGLYQLLFLTKVPASAAVNETVTITKEVVPRAAGLVNAVLRRTDRERQSIPFPDPAGKPAEYIAARHSVPLWLSHAWIDQLGVREAEALAEMMAEPPPLTIRANTLRIDRESLRNRLQDEGVEAMPTEFAPDGLRLASSLPVASLASFREGLFTVQDESSQLAALIVAAQPGEMVLDTCSAPGGKCTYMAQQMKNTGKIISCDRTARKLALVEETCTRLGISIVHTVATDAENVVDLKKAVESRQFDRVLVDAPCSALGVLRRNPEAKWRKTPTDIARLATSQRQILSTASTLVSAKGVIVYSTCSTSREENEAVIEDFLSCHKNFVLENVRLTHPFLAPLITPEGFFRAWPHRHGMDGFFAARLRKSS